MTEPKERLSPKKVQEEMTNKLDKVVASTNDALTATNERIEDVDSKLDQILKAINNPVVIRDAFEPMEQGLGEEGAAEAKEVDGSAVIEHPANVNPDSIEFKNKAAALAFMNEKVKIYIHDTAEKNADKVFEVAVNGVKRVFQRDQEYLVERKYVEGLARAKPIHYENVEYTMSNGERGVKWPTRRGLRYGFSVLEDTQNGKAWLKGVLAEP